MFFPRPTFCFIFRRNQIVETFDLREMLGVRYSGRGCHFSIVFSNPSRDAEVERLKERFDTETPEDCHEIVICLKQLRKELAQRDAPPPVSLKCVCFQKLHTN